MPQDSWLSNRDNHWGIVSWPTDAVTPADEPGRGGFNTPVPAPITNHSFRATGITNYLRNGGTREKAQQMANHSSARTTQLYDRRDEELTVQEIGKALNSRA